VPDGRSDGETRDRIAMLDGWMRKHIVRQWIAIGIAYCVLFIVAAGVVWTIDHQASADERARQEQATEVERARREAQRDRYDALVDRCRTTNKQNEGIMRFLSERAPDAAPQAARYFPIQPDCGEYARRFGATP
jgi:type VI protein secretion system component VasK